MGKPPKHFTTAIGITESKDGLFLLIKTPKCGWEPPGGQVEIEEPIPEALIREIQEETGLNTEIKKMVGVHKRNGPDHHLVEFIFKTTVISGSIDRSRESPKVAWFDYDEIVERMTHPSQEQKFLSAVNPPHDKVEFLNYSLEPYDVLNKDYIDF